jgi:hypothetical protein
MLIEDTDPDFQEYLRARYRSSRAEAGAETRSQEEIAADRRSAEELMARILGQESDATPTSGEQEA